VAKEIELANATENVGAQLVKEVARRLGHRGRRHHDGDRAGAGDLPRGREDGGGGREPDGAEAGIDKAVEAIVGKRDDQGVVHGGALNKLSKPVTGDMIAQVGTISANSDAQIGSIIARQ